MQPNGPFVTFLYLYKELVRVDHISLVHRRFGDLPQELVVLTGAMLRVESAGHVYPDEKNAEVI